MVLAVGHEDAPVAADPDGMNRPEFVGPGVVRVLGRLAPVLDEGAVLVELRDSCPRVAVGHEEGAVGQPGDVGGA
jgi:hypothetical protein